MSSNLSSLLSNFEGSCVSEVQQEAAVAVRTAFDILLSTTRDGFTQYLSKDVVNKIEDLFNDQIVFENGFDDVLVKLAEIDSSLNNVGDVGESGYGAPGHIKWRVQNAIRRIKLTYNNYLLLQVADNNIGEKSPDCWERRLQSDRNKQLAIEQEIPSEFQNAFDKLVTFGIKPDKIKFMNSTLCLNIDGAWFGCLLSGGTVNTHVALKAKNYERFLELSKKHEAKAGTYLIVNSDGTAYMGETNGQVLSFQTDPASFSGMIGAPFRDNCSI